MDKNEVTPELEIVQGHELHKSNENEKLTSKNINQEECYVDLQKFPSPTFNIHIHVPSYNIRGSKIYLPKIQPVIHLHFDEIARRLEINKNEQGEESLYRAFRNLLPVTSPKFGDVRFHFESNSEKKNIEESVECNEILGSTNHYNDCHLRRRKDREKIQPNISKKSKVVFHLNSNKSNSKKNSEGSSDNMPFSAYKDLKMKKAVVVLKDICKSKVWKRAVIAAVKDSDKLQNENESLDLLYNSLYQEENNDEPMDYEIPSVKQENESLTSCLPSSGDMKESYVSDTFSENNCVKVKGDEIVISTSSVQEQGKKNRSLTALAEGCSFSEILSRFRVKDNRYLIDAKECPREKEMDVKYSGEGGRDCVSKTIKSNSNFKENDRSGSELQVNVNETEFELEHKYVTDESASNEQKIPSVFQIIQDDLIVKTKKSDSLSNNNEGIVQKDNEGELSAQQNFDTDSELGKLSKQVILDSATLEFDSSTKITSSRCKDNFEVPETNYSDLFDVGSIDFHLQLIEKEMRRRSQSNSGNNKKSQTPKTMRKSSNVAVKSDKSSPSKRMKLSNKHLKKKASNSSPTENYILLDASGPTKFAVAPVDKVNPYKTHSSKNFKQKMLFGNRVARFSSSDQLRIYQLKQQAGRNSANK